MALNLNAAPYWDDYTDTKKYHKILFKPGYAVQARELTQLQTALQDQIGKFGNHVFKNGAVVSGCDTKIDNKLSFVTIDAPETTVTSYIGATVTGSGGLTAVIIDAIAATGSDRDTLYLRYTGGDGETSTNHFIAAETLTVSSDNIALNGDTFTVSDLAVDSTDATNNYFGYGTRFTLEDGVIYLNGNFVKHTAQTIILSKYTFFPSGKVCVGLLEQIVDAADDDTLTDPAKGSYNYAAPGADRYKLDTELIFVLSGDPIPEGYYQVADIVGGEVSRIHTSDIYSVLGDNMARRTYDESGNYTVRPFPVLVKEHLDTGSNNGLLVSDYGGNSNLLAIGLEAGKAYVRGYEYETRQTEYVITEKGIDTVTKESVPLSTAYGNYIQVNDMLGFFPIDGSEIDLYNAEQNGVSGGLGTSTVHIGTKIGTARVRHIEYVGPDAPGTATAVYNIYVYDVRMTSGDFTDVAGIYYNGTVDGFANVITPAIQEGQYNKLLYRMPSKATKTTKPTGTYNTSFYYTKKFSRSVSSGNMSIALTGDEYFIDGGNVASSAYKKENLLVVKDSTWQVLDLSGVTVDASDPTGQLITFTGLGYTGTATVYATVEINLAAPMSKVLTRDRYVGFSAPSETAGSVLNLGVSDVWKINGVYVGDNTLTYAQIVDLGVDISSDYIFDNGQRDSFYGHASLTRTAAAITDLTGKKIAVSFDYFAHSTSSGGTGLATASYFTVDSYPVNDSVVSSAYIRTEEIPVYYSPVLGESYDLRDTIDFRPRVTDTATPVTYANLASISADPSDSIAIQIPSVGLTIPVPSQELQIDYEYYLGRIDRIIIDDHGVFSAVHGTPSLTPLPPQEPENAMSLAIVTIPPYPSLSPYVAKSSSRPEFGVTFKTMDNRRYTMRDIGNIEQRVARIEYYTSLSLLEKSTESLFIKSAADPTLNRFKNGIMVDAFTGHNVGNPRDAAYSCSIDPYKQELRPFFNIENVDLIYDSANSPGIKKTGDLLTLPYNYTSLSSNLFASKTRNCVGELLFSYIGDMQLDPPVDNWTDTTVQPDVAANFDGNYDNWQTLANAWGTQWGDWQDLVTGRTVSTDTTVTGGQTRVSGDTLFQEQIQISTTTTQQRQTRQGIQLSATPETVTQRLGAKVTNTSLIPFMRSVPITVKCQRLKPNTRIYPFFDGVNVSAHCRKLNSTALTVTPTDPAQYSQYAVTDYGDAIVTDSNGVAVIQFRIPANTFRVGAKNFRVCDDQFNRGAFTTTSATQTFSANGLSQTVQDTVVSTREANLATRSLSDSRSISESSTSVNRLGDRVVGTVQNTTVNNNFTTINNTTNVTNVSNNTTVVNNTNVVNTTVNNITEITNIIEPTPVPTIIAEPETPVPVVLPPVVEPPAPPPVVLPPEPVFVAPVVNPVEPVVEVVFTDPPVLPPEIEPPVPVDPPAPVIDWGFLNNWLWEWNFMPIRLDPLAQSFFVSGMPFGTFSTGIDVFFRTKSTTAPITLQLREMINGVPGERVLPFGEVTLLPDQVTTSTEDGSGNVTFQATRFTFPSPVYLQNNTEYCFVLLPAGNNPDYNVWVSELGENQVGTNVRISEQPNVGMLFTSANNRTWSEKQSEDMKFTVYRAVFDTTKIATAQFQNSNYDYIVLDGTTYYTDNTLTTIVTEEDTIKSISAGDKVYVDGFESTKYGYVKQFDPLHNVLKVVVEAGTFAAGDVITNGSVYIEVSSIEDKLINSIQSNIGFMEFTPTTAIWSYAKTDTGAAAAGSSYERMTFGDTNDLLTEGTIYSYSNEQNDYGGDKTLGLRVGMTTSTDSVSPVIDLRKCSLICVSNHVNNDSTDETTNEGDAFSKYISRRVVLEEQAEDLRVYLSNYIPSGTNIKVYGKFLNESDYYTFDDLDWIELSTDVAPLSATAASGFVEYEYTIPAANRAGSVATAEFEYSRDGVTYTGFKAFAVKIVMLSNNSSVVPKCKELRAIALMV